ncbi:MAG: sucrase ferredoxin [Nocardioidaceae bacterium]
MTPPSTAERCSAASLARDEPQLGTASRVSGFVLLECAGPWGVDALRDSRLPDPVKVRLRELGRTGVKPLLIRRPATDDTADGVRLFVARGGRLRGAVLPDVSDVLDVDLSDGAFDPALADHPGRLFLVCTHGRHDACCAELGRPLWKATQAAAPDRTWQCSHLGGDRFAGNLLVLPAGLYYGRVSPDAAPGLVATHERGELDLGLLRGRSDLPVAAQAAEVMLRRHLGLVSEAPLTLVGQRDGVVVFEDEDRRWRVRVDRSTAPPARLTCRAAAESAAPRFQLVGIDALSRPSCPTRPNPKEIHP